MSDDFDFGFLTVSQEQLKEREALAAQSAKTEAFKANDEKVQRIYNLILPLLENLKKDADTKEYIYWPNRKGKIEAFIAKLQSVIKAN
jgi:hypothetical protein